MQNALFFCAFLLCISSHSVQAGANTTVIALQQEHDSLKIIIRSANLSEDMSTLSSNDDELALLIYDFSDSAIIQPPVIVHSFVLNKNRMSDSSCYPGSIPDHFKKLALFLIEIDSELSAEDIAHKVQVHNNDLMIAYPKKDYPRIGQFLGDDDILGIKIIDDLKSTMPVTIVFRDIYKMDRFEYTITLKK